MDYIPNTDADREEMLKVVGVESVADLFRDVPESFRFPRLDLPPALTEMEIRISCDRCVGYPNHKPTP